MGIIYANSRLFSGPYKEPSYIVIGCEEGSPFRRVFRSKGRAEKFKLKMMNTPRVTHLAMVALPK